MGNLLGCINKFLEGKSKENEFVVLDMGSRYIKYLHVRNNTIIDAFIQENKNDDIKSAVDLLKKQGLISKKIKLSLKGADTIIRYIPFPKVDKTKLKESLTFELSKYVPFPAESVYFDTFILDENYSKEEFLVLLALAKKDFVDNLLKKFEEEKAHITEITLNSLALINIFALSKQTDSNVAILDLGFSSTLLTILNKNVPYLSRDIKISGKSLIDRISAEKNITAEEAEKMLIDIGGDKELEELEEDIFLELTEEIRNSFDYFEMNVGERIQNIYLTGGFSKIKGVDKIISSSLGIEIKPWDIQEKLNITMTKDMPLPKEMLSVAFGLSL